MNPSGTDDVNGVEVAQYGVQKLYFEMTELDHRVLRKRLPCHWILVQSVHIVLMIFYLISWLQVITFKQVSQLKFCTCFFFSHIQSM